MRREPSTPRRGRAACLVTLVAVLHAAGAGALVTVADLSLPGQARSLATSEGIAWVVTLDPGIDPNQPLPCPCPRASLRAIRVSDPQHPEELGVLGGLGDPRTVEVAGGIAYVVESAGLLLIDVSDPTHPVELSRVTSVGRAYDVAVAGSYVYVAGWTGLTVIDVSDPLSPRVLATLEEPAERVEVLGGFAYVVGRLDSGGRLAVVDVSDPGAPSTVGSFDTAGSPTALAVDGSVWIAEDVGSFFLDRSLFRRIDVSDPANPVESGVLEEPSRVLDVESDGAHAYLAGSAGVRAMDVSDAASPAAGGALATRGDAVDIEVIAGFAYVVGGLSLQVIDLAQPDFPAVVGSVELTGRSISDLDVAGDRAYVAENAFDFSTLVAGGFLTVIDASKPGSPREVGRASLRGFAGEVEVVGARAYVSGGSSGVGASRPSSRIGIFDVSDPTAPVEIGSIQAPQAPFGYSVFEVLGERLHLAWPDVLRGSGFVFDLPGEGGFRVIDLAARVARASSGKRVRSDAGSSATDLEVVGDLAYLVDGDAGLRVLDVSRPSAPAQRGALDLPGAGDVAVEQDLAYVTANVRPPGLFFFSRGWLHTVDVSRPTAPRRIGSLDLPGIAREIEVNDGLAYLMIAPSIIYNGRPNFVTLRAFDVSDPVQPRDLGAVPIPAADGLDRIQLEADSLEAAGGLVYIAAGSKLSILDFGPEYRSRTQPVAIDVKPGDARNAIDPRGRGSVRVAILGSADVDVRAVEPRRLAFGPGGAPALGSVAFRDVDRDGATDLVARFLKRHTGLGIGDTEACLRGRLLDGTRFEGCDAVRTPVSR